VVFSAWRILDFEVELQKTEAPSGESPLGIVASAVTVASAVSQITDVTVDVLLTLVLDFPLNYSSPPPATRPVEKKTGWKKVRIHRSSGRRTYR
jgi:hypothetical protein